CNLQSYYQAGQLGEGLKQLFFNSGPKVFAPKVRPDLLFLDVLARNQILSPLEQFITASATPDVEFEKLTQDKNPGICGYILKNNEPVFTCHDCTADPTSVMCNNCFVHSEHKNHNYKMHLSSGNGGYCDCGDPEAFKRYHRCSLHERQAGSQSGAPVSPVEKLPAGMADRFRAICNQVLQLALHLTLLEYRIRLPSNVDRLDEVDLNLLRRWLPHGERTDTSESDAEAGGQYASVLYNDEVHSYPQVINTLTQCLGVDEHDANHFATVVDNDGRSVVSLSDWASAKKLCSEIRGTIRESSGFELGCYPVRSVSFAYQSMCLYLLSWLGQLIKQSDGLHELFCQSLLAPVDNFPGTEWAPGQPLVYYLLVHTDHLWKAARKSFIEMLIKSLLMKANYKRQIAALYAVNQEQIFERFCVDMHHQEDSIAQLSVQLFTSPSLAMYLITEQKALKILVDILIKSVLQRSVQQHQESGRQLLKFSEDDRMPFSRWNRSLHLVRDIEYLLHNDFEQLEPNFFAAINEALPSFLQVYSLFQDTCCARRYIVGHIGFDFEWEMPFIFFLSSMYQNHLLAEFLSRDESVFSTILGKVLDAIEQKPPLSANFLADSGQRVRLAGHVLSGRALAPLMSGRVFISHFQPLVRFLDSLLACTMANHEASPQCRRQLELLANRPGFEIAWLTSARQLAWSAQIAAGLWKRNGLALMNVNLQYSSHQSAAVGMSLRDLHLVQLAAATVPPDQFILRLLDAFELQRWTLGAASSSESAAERYDNEAERSIVEEMLRCLINVVCERRVPGVGQSVAFMEMVEEDLLQHLVAEPQSHSKLLRLANDLVRKLPAADRQLECFAKLDGVIDKLAEFRGVQGQNKGEFHLREQHYSRFNPFYPRLAKSATSKALHSMTKRRAATPAADLPIVRPPQLLAFAAAYQPIVELLHCDVMLGLMRAVVQATKDAGASSKRHWSEVQLERVLYLMLVGLDEDQRRGDRRFLDCVLSGIGEASLMSAMESVPKSRLAMDSVRQLHGYTLARLRRLCSGQGEGGESGGNEAGEVGGGGSGGLDAARDAAEAEVRRRQQQKLAQDRRDRLMAKMMRMQKNFLAEYGDLVEQADDKSGGATASENSTESTSAGRRSDGPLIGPNRTVAHEPQPGLTCLLCQEANRPDSRDPMLLAGLVQRSTVLSQDRGRSRDTDWSGCFVEAELLEGSHFSSCGHAMHRSCYSDFMDSPSNVHVNRGGELGRSRYLCPLCQQLCNCALPVAPSLPCSAEQQQHQFDANADSGRFDSWLSSIRDGVAAGLPKWPPQAAAESRVVAFRKNHDDNSWPGAEAAHALNNLAKVCEVRGLGADLPPELMPTGWKLPEKADPLLLTVAFSLQAAETAGRATERPLFAALPERCAVGLAALVRAVAQRPVASDSDFDRLHQLAINNLSLLLHLQRPNLPLPCLLEADMSTCLVQLTYCLYRMAGQPPDCSVADLCRLIRLVAGAHVFQICLTLPSDPEASTNADSDADASGDDSDCRKLDRLVRQCRSAVGLPPAALSGPGLADQVAAACLPLLRCAAIFYRALTDASAPSEPEPASSAEAEFAWLAGLLQLPRRPCDLPTEQLVSLWCQDSARLQARAASPAVRYPRQAARLVSLPTDYTDLLLECSDFQCPSGAGPGPAGRSLQPAKCLACGKLVCSNSNCCQMPVFNGDRAIGGANLHAVMCTGGTGVFLRVLDCTLLLVSAPNRLGCISSAPYVDRYGETDEYLRRGQPLQLSSAMYSRLQEDWLRHSLAARAGRDPHSGNFFEV
ncbi:hypothetical protein BOX15_Mlig008748g1, partial [Macrostomum lignano]